MSRAQVFRAAGTRADLAEKPTHAEKSCVSRDAHAMLDEHETIDRAEEVKEKRAPKLQSVKSYQFLRGLDHAMLVSTGKD